MFETSLNTTNVQFRQYNHKFIQIPVAIAATQWYRLYLAWKELTNQLNSDIPGGGHPCFWPFSEPGHNSHVNIFVSLSIKNQTFLHLEFVLTFNSRTLNTQSPQTKDLDISQRHFLPPSTFISKWYAHLDLANRDPFMTQRHIHNQSRLVCSKTRHSIA